MCSDFDEGRNIFLKIKRNKTFSPCGVRQLKLKIESKYKGENGIGCNLGEDFPQINGSLEKLIACNYV